MALFKIEKGLAANLATNRPNSVEGYCYFTRDDGKFYIDIATGTALTPAENGGKLAGATRMPINSYLSDWAARVYADKDGNDITSTYGSRLSLSDKYTLKLIAAEGTELSSLTLPKDVDTASKFTSAQTVKLTGAVTGEKSSQAGWEIPTTLADNIVKTAKIADKAVTNEKLANSSITIGGKAVNLGGALTLADMGLNTALRFIGTTSTAITDGSTTSSIIINGSNVTPTVGDVVINSNNSQEYVWLGDSWEILGDESSYALKDHTHDLVEAANRLTSNAGSATTAIYFSEGKPSACNPTINHSITGIVISTFPTDTSSYKQPITWYDSDGATLHSYIGAHNTGDTTGAIIINPLKDPEKNNWDSSQGLYIGKNTLKFWDSIILHSSNWSNYCAPKEHTHGYLPLTGGTMTGNITMSGSVLYPHSNSMIQTAPSSTTYYEPVQWFDKDNKRIGAIGTTSYANGDFATHIQVQREINGKDYYQQLYMIIGADGTGFCRTTKMYGAVWNDYAEFRICNEEFKPGQVVLENGDDTLSIASQRLQRGCSIVSDTFGFAIGETDEAKCPIAVSGRVLAYGYESREEFKKHIGWPVCSGPNGTVSIMTEEEEEKYPSRIIGIISAVPDYETWGSGNVKVNNRIWIKIK